MTRNAVTAAVIATVATVAGATNAQAQRGVCQDLWVERNTIYKARGYCFSTARGISYFGNAGCRYDDVSDVPLSRGERARIAAIRAEERASGCR